MILQNIIFPSTENCIEEKMFFRRTEKTRYSFAEDCVYMKKNAILSFDTYLNAFSATNWLKYTSIENVRLRLYIKGNVKVSLYVKQYKKNRLFERCVYERYFNSDTDGEFFDGEFDTTYIEGIYSVSITALKGNVKVLGGYYYVPNSEIQRNVKLSLIVNTIGNNERYIYSTVNKIQKYLNEKKINDKVQINIIDGAKTVNQEKLIDFEGNVIYGDFLSINIKEKLFEILDKEGTAYAILLDDDVTVTPESIYRIYNFLSLLTPDNDQLIILGELINNEFQWQSQNNKVDDLRLLETCACNEEAGQQKFNSWWYSVMPTSCFRKENLAELELNILEADKVKNKAIYFKGVCAWHDFEKKLSTWKIDYLGNEENNSSRKDILKLQNIIFPSEKNCTDEALYFRRIGNTKYSLADDRVYIEDNGLLNFDTYFNSLSASKWFKYTSIKTVKVRLYIEGKVRISLMYKEKTQSGIIEKCLYENYFDSRLSGNIFDGEFNSEYVNGMYSISVLGVSQESEFLGGYYYVDDIQPRNIGLAIAVCTFKREKYVYANMKMLEDEFLLNDKSELKDRLYINISDNAHTLDITKFRSSHISVFKNKNVGGAGGFTRGIIETKKQEEKNRLTHILLMDDDVVMQPESIYRTYRILSLVKDEYIDAFIGGAMLRTDLQWFQTESGGTWNGGKLVSHKQGLDLRNLDACLYNEVEEKYEFNAWWYCTMPLSIINDKNLPMPIFIRGDDVEFGLRNMKYLILMNGICVWHEPFENKYSSSMFYYIFRNRLIDNAVRNIEYTKEEFLKEFKGQYFRELFTLRYKNAQLLMDGVKDFLKGPEWLINQDGEKLNQDIMSRCYKLTNVNDLNLVFDYPQYEQMLKFIESPMDQKKRKITLNGLFGKHNKLVCVPVHDAHIAYFYRAYGAVNYDAANNKAFETYFDKKMEIELMKNYFRLKKEVNKKYYEIREEYLEAKSILNGKEFWTNYLDI